MPPQPAQAVAALALGLMLSRRFAQEKPSFNPAPVDVACGIDRIALFNAPVPRTVPATERDASMAHWAVVPGANGSVWAIDRRSPHLDRRFCYPEAPTLVEPDGVRYPGFITSTRLHRLRVRTRLRAGDVVIAAFPKSGTSWMEQIVLLLQHGGDASVLNPESQNALAYNRHGIGSVWPERYLDAPLPPRISSAEFDALTGPRVIKSHALPSLVIGLEDAALRSDGRAAPGPIPHGVKLIHVVRSAADAAASAYHHPAGDSAPSELGWPFEAFLTLWASEYHAHGSLSRYLCAWDAYLRSQRSDATLRISYEEIQADPHEAVRRVASFLGILSTDGSGGESGRGGRSDLIERVVKASSFAAMRLQSLSSGSRLAGHIRLGRVNSSDALFTAKLRREFEVAVGTDGHTCAVGTEMVPPVTTTSHSSGSDSSRSRVVSGGGGGGSREAEAAAGSTSPERQEAIKKEAREQEHGSVRRCNFRIVDVDQLREKARRSDAGRAREGGEAATQASEAEAQAELHAMLGASTTPVLVRNAIQAAHWPALTNWSSAERFLRANGATRLRVATGTALAKHGPEDAIRQEWANEPLTLSEFAAARTFRTLPQDAYIFQDIESTFGGELRPLTELWDGVLDARHPERRGLSLTTRSALRPQLRIGVGGAGSGVAFHAHQPALNVLFYGRKRWFVFDEHALRASGHISTVAQLEESALVRESAGGVARKPMGAFARDGGDAFWAAAQGSPLQTPGGHSGDANADDDEVGVSGQLVWQCDQQPSELAWIPGELKHGTLNLADSMAVAAQYDAYGTTPLHLAAHRGIASAIMELGRNGALPGEISSEGHTPLHRAALSGSLGAVRALLDLGGAELARSRTISEGRAPLHEACQGAGYADDDDDDGDVSDDDDGEESQSGREKDADEAGVVLEIASALSRLESDHALVDNADNLGSTPLHLAALHGRAKAARALVDMGASLEVKDARGNTPLDLADLLGREKVAKVLRAAGAYERAGRRTARAVADFFGLGRRGGGKQGQGCEVVDGSSMIRCHHAR
jgi:hypothetical protein